MSKEYELNITFEELVNRIIDKYSIEDICYILQLKEENILEAFSDKVIEKIEEFDVVTSMDYFKDVD
jgi:hypothetical protein|tara:strand:+ start:647 stop:847 length:201 start_codon:yes stop_codon:yes gene_type:complete